MRLQVGITCNVTITIVDLLVLLLALLFMIICRLNSPDMFVYMQVSVYFL
jgi:hypothetical protein